MKIYRILNLSIWISSIELQRVHKKYRLILIAPETVVYFIRVHWELFSQNTGKQIEKYYGF